MSKRAVGKARQRSLDLSKDTPSKKVKDDENLAINKLRKKLAHSGTIDEAFEQKVLEFNKTLRKKASYEIYGVLHTIMTDDDKKSKRSYSSD
jgi:hypothetical protein